MAAYAAENFRSPRIRSRMWRTALAALITVIIYEYILNKRNPCFALIGAVYGVGSQFEEGFHNGINRVIGTLVGRHNSHLVGYVSD
ncbi:MAG: hypothetical protein ACLTML_16470 [Blautia faecis]